MRVLGIDPGTGICGFGVVEVGRGNRMRMVTAGVIKTPAHTPLADRLLDIYDSLRGVIEECRPDEVAIEKLFFNTNITTGISVAQARGVCMLVARQAELPIYEYTPLQIKQSLVGYGRAEKKQVQEMVRIQLGMREVPRPDDAADGLAAAIMHLMMKKGQS